MHVRIEPEMNSNNGSLIAWATQKMQTCRHDFPQMSLVNQYVPQYVVHLSALSVQCILRTAY